MKIPQWLALICAIVTALLALGIIIVIILNPVPTFGGGYSCDFRLAVMRQAAEDTVTELGSQHPASHLLKQRLSDAQFSCSWDDSRYRCQTRD